MLVPVQTKSFAPETVPPTEAGFTVIKIAVVVSSEHALPETTLRLYQVDCDNTPGA